MDWHRVSFDWNRARAFLVTAEEGSFSAAARALQIAQPTIGRQVAALEAELDVTLFERVGRRLVLTPTGTDLFEHVNAMASAATRISRVAAGQAISLDGPICITAGEMVSSFLLPPILAEIRAVHPGIHIEVVASNVIHDLSRREADIAIRNVRPTHADLVAKKLGDYEAHLYASHDYLESIGNPTTADELSRAEFIAFDHGPALMDGLNAIGLRLTPESFPWMSGNQHVQWALVIQGSGIGVNLAEIGDAEPRIRRALPSLPAIPVPMYLTAHREVRTSRRVRVVFDMLAAGLQRSG